MNITHIPIPGGRLNIGQTDAFKTVRIQVACHAPLTKDTVTKRAVLPYLMRSICAKYPTRIAFQTKLEELYAAGFLGSVKRIGLTQEIAFDLHIIHDDYATDVPDLLEEAFQFFHQVMFQPKFDLAIFQEEVRLVEEYFLGLYGDKMRYSLKQLQEQMFQDQPYRFDAMGVLEDLTELTLDDCQQAYQDMMANDAININVVGNVDPTVIESLVNTYFPFTSRTLERTVLDKTYRSSDEPLHIIEHQDVIQGKLAIGYRLPAYYLTDSYYHAVVFNALLGGGPDSLLFRRIREELNKVYFIGSMYDQYKGVMILYAGIDAKDHELVVAEIADIITKIQTKQVSEQALIIAKKALIQNLVESLDSIGAITSRINHLAMFDRTFDQTKLIELVEQTTMDDVANVASMMQLDTSYLLRGESHE